MRVCLRGGVRLRTGCDSCVWRVLMKRFVVGAAALVAAGWTASAEAADMNYGQRAPYTVNQPLNAYSWAGPYLGANLGYEWGSVSNNPAKPAGFVGGVQAGYNFQNGPWVFGVEGDIQAAGADDTFAPWKFSNPWFGTAARSRRLCLQQHHVLRHRGPGFRRAARTDVRLDGVAHHRRLDHRCRRRGWLRPNWSAKLEYLYIDLSSSQFAITGVSNGYSASVVRAGVNYHF